MDATIACYLDTETSGLPDDRLPLDHQDQPHLVQVAAILATIPTPGVPLAEGSPLARAPIVHARCALVVRPPRGFEIPAEAARVHGITTARANRWGVPLRIAVDAVVALALRADVVVAHNATFDLNIMDIAASRLADSTPLSTALAATHVVCTMHAMAPIMDLPPTPRMQAAGRPGPKMPSLAEAYRYVTRQDLAGAHDALADATACMTIHHWLLTRRDR